MLALVLAMLLCVALGAGVVGYVMIEARREGRGGFWTPEGEELIAGARRTGEKVRHRGEEIGRSAAQRTKALRPRQAEASAAPTTGRPGVSEVPVAHHRDEVSVDPSARQDADEDLADLRTDEGYRAAS